jgi:hypothetical protein
MNSLEKNAVRVVAKLAPWLAPFPSAFFVARSSMEHLGLPLAVAVIVAGIIETLGLTTTHTALWAYDWNGHKRKNDPAAPVLLPVALGAVYLLATLGLVVFLEVWPNLSTYAPAIFPVLALVGAVNLALVSRQEQREATVKQEKEAAKAERQAKRSEQKRSVSGQSDQSVNGQGERSNLNGQSKRSKPTGQKEQALSDLVTFWQANPGASYSVAGSAVNRSKAWVVGAARELEAAGRIKRNGNGVEVV